MTQDQVVTSFSSKKGLRSTYLLLRGMCHSHGALLTASFKPRKVAETDISFVEYSASKSVWLTPDIIEYHAEANAPLYNLIIGKKTFQGIGVVLDFKEMTKTIDSILLTMRNIVNLQLKPSITRVLGQNTCLAQEPVSTRNATKWVIEILDVKYGKADLPAIMRDNFSHLEPSHQKKLLSLLLKYESL